MSLFKSIISPMHNCDEVGLLWCKLLGVKVTATTFKKDITEHPDYPSLLSISDVLTSYKVENVSIKTTTEHFSQFPTPFIAQINGINSKFSLFSLVVKVFDNNKLEWYNPENKKKEIIATSEFEKVFTGVVMLADKAENAGEENYTVHHKRERLQNIRNVFMLLTLPLLLVVQDFMVILNDGVRQAFIPVLFGMVTLTGVLTGVLLLLFETDQYNPALQKVCHGGRKTNCSAILNSAASQVLGISWSVIGFSYFTGILITILLTGIGNEKVLTVASWFSLICLPYIPFSVYYQWRVARQWCPMCLTIQVVFLLQFLILLSGGFIQPFSVVFIPLLVRYIFIIAFVLSVTQLLVTIYKQAKKGKYARQELTRLKHSPDIFNALLKTQKQINTSTEGLGITIGNPQAPIKLIKVCNPYCGPCSKAHTVIESLLENNENIQLQIIFTAIPDPEDERSLPVSHLLAIDRLHDKETLKKALGDWYLPEKKDFDLFIRKYPVESTDKDALFEQIGKMFEWCKSTNIEFTPTFFLNGYQLPQQYSVRDLKYFLSV